MGLDRTIWGRAGVGRWVRGCRIKDKCAVGPKSPRHGLTEPCLMETHVGNMFPSVSTVLSLPSPRSVIANQKGTVGRARGMILSCNGWQLGQPDYTETAETAPTANSLRRENSLPDIGVEVTGG